MTYHEVAYRPWMGAHGDVEKQKRRFLRLVKISFLEDFTTMSGLHRGAEVSTSLTQRWRRLQYDLLMADSAEMRKAALHAPPQLRYFLTVSARVCEELAGRDDKDMVDYDAWIGLIAFPTLDSLFSSDD